MSIKDFLKIIPGYRSNKLWKKVIASVYYLFCFWMMSNELTLGLFTITWPFIFFSIIDLIKYKIKGKKLRGPVITLVIAIAVFFTSIMMPTAESDKVSKEKSKIETKKEEVKPKPVKKENNIAKQAKPKTKSKENDNTKVNKPTLSDIKRDLSIHYIDIGQGDSILIKLPNGENVLIDGGPSSNKNDLISYLDKQGIKNINYLIATHPHEDHIGGLPDVINRYEIGKVYLPEKTHTTKTYEKLLKSIQTKDLKITIAKKDHKIIDTDNLHFEILWPETDYSNSNLNNHSVVTKLTFNDKSFLFTGDAEDEVENKLFNENINVDILKIGHHGSNTSTSKQFLDKTKPKSAVISCGKDNQYAHPHNEIIAKLESNDVDVYRTDLQGTIVVIVSNDGKVTFNKEANPKNENAPPKEDKTSSSNKSNNSDTNNNSPSNKQSSNDYSSKQHGDGDVFITKTGSRYHTHACGRGNYFSTTLADAKSKGLTPCQKCY